MDKPPPLPFSFVRSNPMYLFTLQIFLPGYDIVSSPLSSMTAIVWERVIASMQQNRPSSARINRSLRSSAGSSSKRDGNTDQFDHDTREMETANVERTKRRDKRLSHTRAGNERRGLSAELRISSCDSNGRIFSATNIFAICLCRERICWTSR